MTINQDTGRLAHVLASMLTEPWLIAPAAHAQYLDIVRAHATGGSVTDAQHAIAAQMDGKKARKEYTVVDGVAIVDVSGPLLRKVSGMWRASGINSVDAVQRAVENASADSDVQAIVLDVDSPGGVAMGTPETAQAVREARQAKPVIAHVDGMAASAAYWIASQAHLIYANPSSEVGSIGVYMAMLDSSRAYANEGHERVLIKTGTMKGAAYPGTPITADQRAMFQTQVDKIGTQFRAAVRSTRGGIADDVMQGQTFDVDDARQAGLLDEVGSRAMAVRDAKALAKLRAKGQWR